MALEGIMFDTEKNIVDDFPIEENFHDAIFNEPSQRFKSYILLRKLCHYYNRKNVRFSKKEIKGLCNDLELYKSFVKPEYHNEIELFIKKLSNPNVIEVIFYSD